VSIGGDDEAPGHRKTGGCQSDEIAPPAAHSRYKAALRLIEVDDQTHKATPFQSSTRCDYGCGEGRCPALMYREFNPIYVLTIGMAQPAVDKIPPGPKLVKLVLRIRHWRVTNNLSAGVIDR